MKIYLGPYRYRITWPYRLHDWYFAKRFGKFNYDYSEQDYNNLDKVVEAVTMKIQDVINTCINKPWLDKRHRKKNIRIDYYDVWSADNTIAMVVHPLLVLLKEKKHGSPQTDDEDAPEHLRSTAAVPKENDWDSDNNIHARWEWILDEMIWAFEQCAKEDHGDSQFFSGEVDWNFIKDSDTGLSQIVDGPKSTFKVDYEGKKAHYDRIKNGLRLFAKYYFGLWD
jgi:hypothetical protein